MVSRVEMGNAPLGLATEWYMLAVESQHAMWLRAVKLCAGGAAAEAEAQLMMTEKISAARSAIVSLLNGSMPVGVVRDYRSAVRANVVRLSSA